MRFVKDFFEESKEEIIEQIKELESNLGLYKKKLNKLRKQESRDSRLNLFLWLNSFFEESEEELREQIKETETSISDLKKELHTFRSKKKSSNSSETFSAWSGKKLAYIGNFFRNFMNGLNSFYNKNKLFSYIFILFIILGITFFYNANYFTHYFCTDSPSWVEESIALSCMDIVFDNGGYYVYFKMQNLDSFSKDCDIDINISDSSLKRTLEYEGGVLNSNQRKLFKFKVDSLSGKSSLHIIPDCEKTNS